MSRCLTCGSKSDCEEWCGKTLPQLMEEIIDLRLANEEMLQNMLIMRERLSGKSVSYRALKIIDEHLVKSGILKEEESIQCRLFGRKILPKNEKL